MATSEGCWLQGYRDALEGRGYRGAGCWFPGSYFHGYATGRARQ